MSMLRTPGTKTGRVGLRAVPELGFRENLAGLLAARNDQLGFLERNLQKHGDIFRMRLGGFPMLMVNHPDHVHHILVENHANYDKDNFLYRAIRPILRDGLTGSPGGPEWQLHRRLMQRSFHRSTVADFTGPMTELTSEVISEWGAAADRGSVIDVSARMANLTLRVVLRSLFGVDSEGRDGVFERDFLEVNRLAGEFLRFPFPPLSWRTPSRNRLRALIGELDAFVADVVAIRSRSGEERADLFSLLANAMDEETGVGMTTDQVSQEILGMIIAGYETSSHAQSWVLYQLAGRPEVQRRVQEEVDSVLDGREPGFADLAKLSYTRMVIEETLRLCTPAWQTMRRAIDEDEVGGYRVPRGSDIYLNLFTLHRHPLMWPEPTRFDPERFTPQAVADRPRHAYQPFGSGPRHCIGKHFALTELQLVTAMLAQSFTFSCPEGQPPVGFAPLVTLHPKGGIHLLARRR